MQDNQQKVTSSVENQLGYLKNVASKELLIIKGKPLGKERLFNKRS